MTFATFGASAALLGHAGDSWSYMLYMSEIDAHGAWAIIRAQPGRLALPVAWAIGWLAAGPAPWIYHALVAICLGLAAACLYALVLTVAPRAYLFAYAVAVLSIVWPSDPTRYDVATLGNRQALLLWTLGCLAYARAVVGYRRSLLALAAISITLSLLTYEGQLLLAAALPLSLACCWRRIAPDRRLSFVLALAAPVLIWLIVNAAVVASAPDHRMYQTGLAPDADVGRVLTQLRDGVRVLLVDCLSVPLQLLRDGSIPNVPRAAVAAAAVTASMLALVPVGDGLPGPRASRGILVGAIVTVVLGLAVFAITPIDLGQAGRTQTFTLAGAAALAAVGASALGGAVSVPRQAPVLGKLALVALACPVLFLFFALDNVYERNYTDIWRDQRRVLESLVTQAPDIADGSLVMITELPDTRLVFPSNYTCEFALAYLMDHPEPRKPPFGPPNIDELVRQRISCGLTFNGRHLDLYTRVQLAANGVVESFQIGSPLFPGSQTFPYSRTVFFAYQADGSVKLMDRLPVEALVAGANASSYQPRALIGAAPRNRDRLRWLPAGS